MSLTSPIAGLAIRHQLDADITPPQDQQLRHLLMACFPLVTPVLLTRRYIREAPRHRFLARTPHGDLAGHVALHEKIIGLGTLDVRIGGVAEVCVGHPYRGQGLLKRMLAEVHAWMQNERLPFALLFGQPKIYNSSGYVLISNELVTENSLSRHWNPFCGKPMVRQTGDEPWPEGKVDLRGPTF